MDAGSRKWGAPYLTRRFFTLLSEPMAERVLLIMGEREDRFIAGALNLIGDDALHGRNCACIEDWVKATKQHSAGERPTHKAWDHWHAQRDSNPCLHRERVMS